MEKAVIRIEKSKFKARRNYKIEFEFNTDRVLSKRNMDILLDTIAEQINNPRDVDDNGNYVSATFKTIILHRGIEYRKPLGANGEEE
jgi:hypothetical protein